MPSQKSSKGSASKSVRFSSKVEERIVPDEEESVRKRPPAADAAALRKKRPRLDRPNPDEEDDIDDWEPDEEEEEVDESLPDSKELLQAKRERRLKREGKTTGLEDVLDEDETHVDAETSLLSENKGDPEIPIEAFNMDAERTDGSGYFAGDTYIFRKRDMDEEPDAWLDSLNDDQKGGGAAAESSSGSERDEDVQDDLDRWTREDLYAKMIPLVGDKETVLQAVARYGALLKRTKTNKNNNDEAETARKMAQTKLNDLTEAANALLLKGDVDVYQQTKADMVKVVSESKAKEASSNRPATASDAPKPVVQWEYQGNEDGQVHGPFSTQQMTGWIQAGYFIGPQAVQIRTVSKESPKDKSTVDDLLSDLMDDDEAKEAEPEEVRGEWQSSNDVNFAAYS